MILVRRGYWVGLWRGESQLVIFKDKILIRLLSLWRPSSERLSLLDIVDNGCHCGAWKAEGVASVFSYLQFLGLLGAFWG